MAKTMEKVEEVGMSFFFLFFCIIVNSHVGVRLRSLDGLNTEPTLNSDPSTYDLSSKPRCQNDKFLRITRSVYKNNGKQGNDPPTPPHPFYDPLLTQSSVPPQERPPPPPSHFIPSELTLLALSHHMQFVPPWPRSPS